MPGHVFLAGERTTLRTVERSDRDLDLLGRVRNEPAFRHALGFDRPWSRGRVEDFFESVADDESSLNLLICLDGDREADRGGDESPARRESDETPTRRESDGAPTRRESDGAPAGPTPIGAVNLFDVDRVGGTLSYWLLESRRGAGYASEAVPLVVDHAIDELGLHRVEAEVFAENDPSMRLLERLGFVHEGTSRECRFAGGAFRDVERYAVLANEWRGRESDGRR